MQNAGSLGHLAMAKELRRSQVLRPIIWGAGPRRAGVYVDLPCLIPALDVCAGWTNTGLRPW